MHHRRTKIVATVGPASREIEQLVELVDRGVDVFRINTSHLSLEQAVDLYTDIERARPEFHKSVAILVDLQGPKIRLGEIPAARIVEIGQWARLVEGAQSIDESLPVNIPGIGAAFKPGMRIRLGDGAPELVIERVDDEGALAKCVVGGGLRSRMGIMFPPGTLTMPALTERDRAHIGVANAADFFALSFVSHAEDVMDVRRELDRVGSRARIIAKIERQEALTNLIAIIDASDGVMVARGDLGVEIGLAHVPFAQRWTTDVARTQLKSVITATQVMESMIHADVPTRAEITDLANAVSGNTSAVMLSAETATGAHPPLVIEQMRSALETIECYRVDEARDETFSDPRASLVRAADQLAHGLGVRKIIVPTDSGDTARFAAALARPTVIALAADERVRRQLAIERGVFPLAWDGHHGDSLPATAVAWAMRAGWVEPNEQVVVAWGEFHNGAASQLVASLNLDAVR